MEPFHSIPRGAAATPVEAAGPPFESRCGFRVAMRLSSRDAAEILKPTIPRTPFGGRSTSRPTVRRSTPRITEPYAPPGGRGRIVASSRPQKRRGRNLVGKIQTRTGAPSALVDRIVEQAATKHLDSLNSEGRSQIDEIPRSRPLRPWLESIASAKGYYRQESAPEDFAQALTQYYAPG
jgi:hypothetical protein